MDGNIDTIYRNVCVSARWIVCPFCKYFAETLSVARGVFKIMSGLSLYSWLRRLQKLLGLYMEEGDVFKDCCEWLEFSQRATVVFTCLLKEFEDLLEQFEIDPHIQDSSDGCSAATITQNRRDCHSASARLEELTTDYNTAVCQSAAKALLPNSKPTARHMEPIDKPASTTASTTARHKLSTAEKAGPTASCSHQQLHVHQMGARQRWRRTFLVIRAARVLLSLLKPKEERSAGPAARPRVGSYTPARPPLLPCPPACVQSQTQPGVAEAKSAPIMIFSEGPQIHLISQELRAKLESHVRRKRTHRVFGFPPKLTKLLGDSAASVLKCTTTDDRQAHRSFSKTKSNVNTNRNTANCKDSGFLNVIDLNNTELLEETKSV